MDIAARVFNTYDYPAWLYRQSNSIVKKDTSILYYDCSNFYFECEQADEDTVDEVTGEVLKGLRQYGVSKEHRPTPIVEMGLFMDRDGIPITMCLHPGNTSEQTTAIPPGKGSHKDARTGKVHLLRGRRTGLLLHPEIQQHGRQGLPV